jgi:hypothetical protein
MMDNLTTKDDRGKRTGFVGFFDILGYGSFLESGITDVTSKVVEILATLPQWVGEELKGHLGNAVDADMQSELEQVVPLVVSDSILLRSAYDENCDLRKRASQAASFVMAADVLQRKMFEFGLPLRGAIAFGDFIVRGYVFAGKPIIDAYKLGHGLQLAACAIHEMRNANSVTVSLEALNGRNFWSTT